MMKKIIFMLNLNKVKSQSILIHKKEISLISESSEYV